MAHGYPTPEYIRGADRTTFHIRFKPSILTNLKQRLETPPSMMESS